MGIGEWRIGGCGNEKQNEELVVLLTVQEGVLLFSDES